MNTRYLFLPLSAGLMLFAAGCDDSADKRMSDRQETLQRQQLAQTGLPAITNFTEAKLVRHLYELRDQKILTYAYIPDMNGKLWHLCDSIGYGLPYGVQFSNPEKQMDRGNLPQAEPNGLFMPATAEGTWVTCINPNQPDDVAPVYAEPRVIVSPFKLKADGDYSLKK